MHHTAWLVSVSFLAMATPASEADVLRLGELDGGSVLFLTNTEGVSSLRTVNTRLTFPAAREIAGTPGVLAQVDVQSFDCVNRTQETIRTELHGNLAGDVEPLRVVNYPASVRQRVAVDIRAGNTAAAIFRAACGSVYLQAAPPTPTRPPQVMNGSPAQRGDRAEARAPLPNSDAFPPRMSGSTPRPAQTADVSVNRSQAPSSLSPPGTSAPASIAREPRSNPAVPMGNVLANPKPFGEESVITHKYEPSPQTATQASNEVPAATQAQAQVLKKVIDSCASSITLTGTLIDGLKPQNMRLKELWCLIASEEKELLVSIEINDDFQAGVTTGLGVDAHLTIGNLLLQQVMVPRYIEALDFILSHELGHYKLHHASIRKLAEFSTVLVGGVAAVRMIVKPSWKRLALGTAATLGAYCLAFNKYKADETAADRFAISHLRHLQRNSSKPADKFLQLMRDEKVDPIDPECFNPQQIAKDKSLFISSRKPHPYFKGRERQIRNELEGTYIAPLIYPRAP